MSLSDESSLVPPTIEPSLVSSCSAPAGVPQPGGAVAPDAESLDGGVVSSPDGFCVAGGAGSEGGAGGASGGGGDAGVGSEGGGGVAVGAGAGAGAAGGSGAGVETAGSTWTTVGPSAGLESSGNRGLVARPTIRLAVGSSRNGICLRASKGAPAAGVDRMPSRAASSAIPAVWSRSAPKAFSTCSAGSATPIHAAPANVAMPASPPASTVPTTCVVNARHRC